MPGHGAMTETMIIAKMANGHWAVSGVAAARGDIVVSEDYAHPETQLWWPVPFVRQVISDERSCSRARWR